MSIYDPVFVLFIFKIKACVLKLKFSHKRSKLNNTDNGRMNWCFGDILLNYQLILRGKTRHNNLFSYFINGALFRLGNMTDCLETYLKTPLVLLKA